MKMVCVDNNSNKMNITINKIYKDLSPELDNEVMIKNDSDIISYYHRKRFIPLREYNLNKLIN